ncbi:PP2C family protein-serine/threonine phosphatase [Nesterenkonia aerolata]|uniref:Protein phosphatase 2C domain-containing protein n=1 Tax=Nesterenkonia aerolata TaxID=3074079 RepID=A0ABU2DTS6_9MICC|nr:protein phosphatase 2C domain-containing protein [Nesterenkonia sp. LY-0111]MDR8019893.1 protein phosphatase 2C domain-containing protein [Nesterenkonia sp. LY-0111]
MSSEQIEQTQGLYLDYGYGSHVGLRRELNEDSSVVTDSLFAVADGMGGHEAGEVASALAVQVLAEQWQRSERGLTAQDIERTVREADERIRRETAGRAGTTLTGAVICGAEGSGGAEGTEDAECAGHTDDAERAGQAEGSDLQWLIFNIGDSRTYIFQDGALHQITVDHSQVQELYESGMITAEERQYHPQRNVVTRAVGAGETAGPEVFTAPVEAGQRLLICSDGLCGELEADALADILGAGRSPQDTVDWLIHAALRAGGRDNVTVVVVDVRRG